MLDSEWWHNAFVVTVEGILLLGALMTAIGLGFKRIYSVARSVEKILEFTKTEKEAREAVAQQLLEHIRHEDERDEKRDHQILELVSNLREVSREIRPNGGSSMKDVVNNTNMVVNQLKTQVAVIEEWKRLHP
jgi:hypothetical protein